LRGDSALEPLLCDTDDLEWEVTCASLTDGDRDGDSGGMIASSLSKSTPPGDDGLIGNLAVAGATEAAFVSVSKKL